MLPKIQQTDIIKVGSKSWLLTCSSNISLSQPSYTGSALKRELNFCNGYLSLSVGMIIKGKKNVVSIGIIASWHNGSV